MPKFVGSLDANIILRLLLNDVPKQNQAAMSLLKNASGQFAIADIALVEVAFVLERAYEFKRPQIVEVLQAFMQQPSINCNRILFDNAFELFEQHTSLSLEDCCLAVYAKLNDAEPLFTFDKKLANSSLHAQLLKS